MGLGPIPVRVSRQSGGKGKRNQSRNLGVFMRQMVNCMYQCCGKPRYDAVATMTNIAFPGCRRGRGKCPFGLQADDADSQTEAVHSTTEMT